MTMLRPRLSTRYWPMLPPVTHTQAWVGSGPATDWAAVEPGRHPTDGGGVGDGGVLVVGRRALVVVGAARTLTRVLGCAGWSWVAGVRVRCAWPAGRR